jgi:hypothetical protein
MKAINIFIFITFFLSASCSDQENFKQIAIKQAQEKNCKPEVELLLQHEDTELWASYSNYDSSLLCLYTCKNNKCTFSTEQD